MMKRFLLSCGLAAFALSACETPPQTSAPAPDAVQAAAAPSADSFSFIVIGDTPYDDRDKKILDQAVEKISGGGFPFIIHLGDYKGGGAECLPGHDDYQEALIKRFAPVPVFYTPGDNEWTDCDRFKHADTGENYSDLDRLGIIRNRFFSGQAPTDFGASHQAGMPENARWSYGGAVFATLHVTGTNNGRNWVTGDPLPRAEAAADARDAANAAWLFETFDMAEAQNAGAVILAMQSDMTDVDEEHVNVPCSGVGPKSMPCDAFIELREAIQAKSAAFGKPVLLMHGDTSPFTLSQEFMGAEAPNLWRLNAAGDAGENKLTGQKWGTRDVTLVTIDAGQDIPFTAQGFLTGKPTKTK